MPRTALALLFAFLLAACGTQPPPPPAGPVANAIRERIEARIRVPAQKPFTAMDRALQQLYAARDYRPLWNDPLALTALMQEGFVALQDEGLRPEHYIPADWRAQSRRAHAPERAAQAAEFDLQISRRYLRALSNVAYGRVDPADVGTDWESSPTALGQRLSLAWAGLAAQTGAVAGAIAAARPPEPAYAALRAALPAHRKDPQRHAQLRVNLERTRWLFHDLPPSHVLVDIAGYQLHYRRPDGRVWSSRVIIGKPFRETPALRSAIDTVTFNPTWTVPPTIFLEDIAPKARRDAAATLKAKQLRALDAQGRDVPLDSIDWNDPKSVILRQDPGPENPLGQVKLLFDNAYQVYLHDTPSKGLFAAEERAASSGCIRVQDALQLAQLLLADTGTEANLSQALQQDTHDVRLKRPVPVLLHYATVEVGTDGAVRFRDDLYGRDAVLLAALDRGR